MRLPTSVTSSALVVLLLGLGACGSQQDSGDRAADEGSGSAASGRIVEHAYGETTVTGSPERVIALGWTDVDNALALGVTPVGFRDWFGKGLSPWATALAGRNDADDAPTAVDDGEGGFSYEAVASLEPDLIFANDGMTEEQYDRLSDIAPTVGPIEGGDSFGVEWQRALERTGEILGRSDEAQTQVAEVEQRIEAVAAEHPEYAGRTIGLGFAPGPDDQPALSTTESPRLRLLTSLGFVPSAGTEEVSDEPDGDLHEFSEERMSLFEADLLFLYDYVEGTEAAALEQPTFAALEVVRDGHVVWMPADVADALTFGTGPAITHVLEALPALIEQTGAT